MEFGGPVYCLAWDSKQRQLIAGGRGAVQLLKVLRSSSNYMQTDSEKKAVGYVYLFSFLQIYSQNSLIKKINLVYPCSISFEVIKLSKILPLVNYDNNVFAYKNDEFWTRI